MALLPQTIDDLKVEFTIIALHPKVQDFNVVRRAKEQYLEMVRSKATAKVITRKLFRDRESIGRVHLKNGFKMVVSDAILREVMKVTPRPRIPVCELKPGTSQYIAYQVLPVDLGDYGIVWASYLERCLVDGKPQLDYSANSTAQALYYYGWLEGLNDFDLNVFHDLEHQGTHIDDITPKLTQEDVEAGSAHKKPKKRKAEPTLEAKPQPKLPYTRPTGDRVVIPGDGNESTRSAPLFKAPVNESTRSEAPVFESSCRIEESGQLDRIESKVDTILGILASGVTLSPEERQYLTEIITFKDRRFESAIKIWDEDPSVISPQEAFLIEAYERVDSFATTMSVKDASEKVRDEYRTPGSTFHENYLAFLGVREKGSKDDIPASTLLDWKRNRYPLKNGRIGYNPQVDKTRNGRDRS